MKISEMAEALGGRIIGDGNHEVYKIANLATAQSNEVSFLSDEKMRKYLAQTKAGAVIVKESMVDTSSSQNYIVVADPYVAFAKIAQIFDTTPRSATGIHPSAVIDPTAVIEQNVSVGANAVIEADAHICEGAQIGPNCFVGKGTVIGKNTKLWANVSIYHNCVIGERCLFQSGAVIGSDGFGYANERGRWIKIPQVGRVVIGNDVEIGASTTIDRGAIDDTVIEDNVIIDNQVQVAHNDKIGYGTAIAGATVIAGSVNIGRYCIIGGTSVFNGHISVCDGAHILGQVGSNIKKPGKYESYLPVTDAATWARTQVRMHQIEKIYKRLVAAEKKLAEISDNQGKE